MRRLVLLVAIASFATTLGACGGADVDVLARLVNPNDAGGADTVALADLPVHLLPFDRDAVFDSLTKVSSQPEPQIPDSLLQLQQQIASAQEQWQDAENSWAQARDSLKTISDRLKSLSRGSPEYRVLFQDFDAVDQREKTARQRMDQAFARFTELQSRFSAQSQEIKAQRDAWGNDAFASVDSVFQAKMDAMGRDEMTDTTNAAGAAVFHPKKGKWWVYARYELPYTELYWNVPVEVGGGDPIQIILSRDNAQKRPKL